MKKIYGYIRVSTDKQEDSEATQRMEIFMYANQNGMTSNIDDINYHSDVAKSGKVPWKKRKVNDILNVIQKNDILITTELSRIGRGMLDILSCINEFKKKEVNMYFTKTDTLKINGENELMNNILLSSLAIACELERTLISERTKKALLYKKKQGIIGGRKKGDSKLNQYENNIKDDIANGYKMCALSKKYHCTNATLSHFVKVHNLKPKKELKE